MKTKISVAICTYNGESFLKEQIDSILNQTLKVDEIVVCDDGSTDGTLDILEDYENRNPNVFRIFENKINLKSVKNFEQAIKKCSGDYIFLSDQDDIWATNKVEKYIDYFYENKNINVLASNGFCINDKSKVLNRYSLWDIPQYFREKKIEFCYFDIISRISNIATGATIAIRRNFLIDILPFPDIKDLHHDEWIALISSYRNSFEILNDKYFYYRIHEKQQVGGVFYDENTTNLDLEIEFFDYNNKNVNFYVFKHRLNKLAKFYNLNYALKSIDEKKMMNYDNIINKIIALNKKTKILMKKKYFFKSNVLFITDFILNKRQITSQTINNIKNK